MDAIFVNDKRRFSGPFQIISTSAYTDPTAVTATVRLPNGTVTVYTYLVDAALVKDTTGQYHIDVTPTTPGELIVGFRGVGVVDTYNETAVYVLPAGMST